MGLRARYIILLLCRNNQFQWLKIVYFGALETLYGPPCDIAFARESTSPRGQTNFRRNPRAESVSDTYAERFASGTSPRKFCFGVRVRAGRRAGAVFERREGGGWIRVAKRSFAAAPRWSSLDDDVETCAIYYVNGRSGWNSNRPTSRPRPTDADVKTRRVRTSKSCIVRVLQERTRRGGFDSMLGG